METKKVAALIAAFISIVNIICSALNITPIELNEEQIYQAVSIIALIISWASNVWYNFNFTRAAKEGQKVTDAIKAAQYEENNEDYLYNDDGK